jgi:CheY-like chemotaxis protein
VNANILENTYSYKIFVSTSLCYLILASVLMGLMPRPVEANHLHYSESNAMNQLLGPTGQYEELSGLKFRLSSGTSPQDEKKDVSHKPQVERLSAIETERVLDRLPAMPNEMENGNSFTASSYSKPPSAENVARLNFDSNAGKIAPPAVEFGGRLEVTDYSPVGDVDVSAQITVTFSSPMVEFGSLQEMNIPQVKLSPQLAGEWQWIGAQTLTFASPKALPAADGSEALSIGLDPDLSFDLVITDLLLPKMTGEELATRLRRARPGLSILFMSGYDLIETTKLAGQMGVRLLRKPFSIVQFLDAVRQCLAT